MRYPGFESVTYARLNLHLAQQRSMTPKWATCWLCQGFVQWLSFEVEQVEKHQFRPHPDPEEPIPGMQWLKGTVPRYWMFQVNQHRMCTHEWDRLQAAGCELHTYLMQGMRAHVLSFCLYALPAASHDDMHMQPGNQAMSCCC